MEHFDPLTDGRALLDPHAPIAESLERSPLPALHAPPTPAGGDVVPELDDEPDDDEPEPERDESEDYDAESPGQTRPSSQRTDKAEYPCLCAQYVVVDPETGEQKAETGCDQKTRSRFAPGHDAKLKSLLINAGVHGWRVVERDDRAGVQRRPMTIANRFRFGPQVKRAIDNRRRSWS